MIRKISTSTSFEAMQFKKPNIKTQQTQTISRVEEIKRAINKGEYKTDIQQTAKAMAKALL